MSARQTSISYRIESEFAAERCAGVGRRLDDGGCGVGVPSLRTSQRRAPRGSAAEAEAAAARLAAVERTRAAAAAAAVAVVMRRRPSVRRCPAMQRVDHVRMRVRNAAAAAAGVVVARRRRRAARSSR